MNCLGLLPPQILHLPFLFLLNEQLLNGILVWTFISALILDLFLCTLPSHGSLSLWQSRWIKSLWASYTFLWFIFINKDWIGWCGTASLLLLVITSLLFLWINWLEFGWVPHFEAAMKQRKSFLLSTQLSELCFQQQLHSLRING
jgi:hypothetical protein